MKMIMMTAVIYETSDYNKTEKHPLGLRVFFTPSLKTERRNINFPPCTETRLIAQIICPSPLHLITTMSVSSASVFLPYTLPCKLPYPMLYLPLVISSYLRNLPPTWNRNLSLTCNWRNRCWRGSSRRQGRRWCRWWRLCRDWWWWSGWSHARWH